MTLGPQALRSQVLSFLMCSPLQSNALMNFTPQDYPCLPLCDCLAPAACTMPCQVLECQQQQQMQFPTNHNPFDYDHTVGNKPYDNSANNNPQQQLQQQQTQPGAEPQLNPAWTPQNNNAIAVEMSSMTVFPLVYIAVMLLL